MSDATVNGITFHLPDADWLSDQEVSDLVRGYSDAELAANYRAAEPGKEWGRLLSAEIGRRDALGSGLLP